MKRLGFAIAAIFAAAMFASPLAAAAQSYGSGGGGSAGSNQDVGKATKLPAYGDEQFSRGKKEAPPFVTAAALPCSVTDAAYVGHLHAQGRQGQGDQTGPVRGFLQGRPRLRPDYLRGRSPQDLWTASP